MSQRKSNKRRRNLSTKTPRWALITLAVCAVTSLALATFAVAQSEQPSAARWSPPPVSALTAEPVAVASGPLRVAFLGDSYTTAEGADPTRNYVQVLSDLRHWEPIPLGEGGTGYTGAGQADEGDSVFLERIPLVVAAAPDVVVVQGSTNDLGTEAATHDAAAAVFAALHAQLPDATVIAVGPLSPPAVDPAGVDRARAGISAAASEAGIFFVDPTAEGWLSDRDELFVDGVHPDNTGQGIIGELLNKILPANAKL